MIAPTMMNQIQCTSTSPPRSRLTNAQRGAAPFGYALRRAGGPATLLRFLAGVVRGLLLGGLVLGVDVGLLHELPAPAPAERPGDEDDREDDVQGGREELL